MCFGSVFPEIRVTVYRLWTQNNERPCEAVCYRVFFWNTTILKNEKGHILIKRWLMVARWDTRSDDAVETFEQMCCEWIMKWLNESLSHKTYGHIKWLQIGAE